MAICGKQQESQHHQERRQGFCKQIRLKKHLPRDEVIHRPQGESEPRIPRQPPHDLKKHDRDEQPERHLPNPYALRIETEGSHEKRVPGNSRPVIATLPDAQHRLPDPQVRTGIAVLHGGIGEE